MALAENDPDLILMDLDLPVVDGWEATRRLKANAGNRDNPHHRADGSCNVGLARQGTGPSVATNSTPSPWISTGCWARSGISSGDRARPVEMESAQATNSACSPPHETRACPGFAYECASRACPTCGGGRGWRWGRSKDTTTVRRRRAGSQTKRKRSEQHRTSLLELRIVSNIDGVLEDIPSEITTTPTPNPSPQGGGEHTECAATVLHQTKRDALYLDCGAELPCQSSSFAGLVLSDPIAIRSLRRPAPASTAAPRRQAAWPP